METVQLYPQVEFNTLLSGQHCLQWFGKEYYIPAMSNLFISKDESKEDEKAYIIQWINSHVSPHIQELSHWKAEIVTRNNEKVIHIHRPDPLHCKEITLDNEMFLVFEEYIQTMGVYDKNWEMQHRSSLVEIRNQDFCTWGLINYSSRQIKEILKDFFFEDTSFSLLFDRRDHKYALAGNTKLLTRYVEESNECFIYDISTLGSLNG